MAGVEKGTYKFRNSNKDRVIKPPVIVRSRHIERTNLVVAINGDDELVNEEIKNELMLFIRRLQRKHKLGFAIMKLHGRKSNLAKFLEYLFDFY